MLENKTLGILCISSVKNNSLHSSDNPAFFPTVNKPYHSIVNTLTNIMVAILKLI